MLKLIISKWAPIQYMGSSIKTISNGANDSTFCCFW